MHAIKFVDISEKYLSDKVTDQETFESLKILAKILLSFTNLETTDTPLINLNQTSEKLAA